MGAIYIRYQMGQGPAFGALYCVRFGAFSMNQRVWKGGIGTLCFIMSFAVTFSQPGSRSHPCGPRRGPWSALFRRTRAKILDIKVDDFFVMITMLDWDSRNVSPATTSKVHGVDRSRNQPLRSGISGTLFFRKSNQISKLHDHQA